MINDPLWLLTGWTMLHFLWVGAVIAILTLLARAALRSAAPLARYGVTLVGFVLLTAAPALIAGYLWQNRVDVAQPALSTSVEYAAEPPIVANPNEPTATIDLAITPIEAPVATPTDENAAAEGAAEPTALNPWTTSEQLAIWLDRAAGWLPWLWLVGAPLTFLLLATGLIGVERLRRDCQPITDGPLHAALVAAAKKLRINGRAALALSERVAQPMLIGVLRPLVLLPASAASGWTPEQFEMVLLHELAHARRWDNLVNLLQRLVESLLFFHPAVWLVSRWLRADREQCCDALVVRLTADPRSYAELLVAVAEQNTNRELPLAATAMAAHPLARRIRRILQLEEEPMMVSKKLLATLLVVGLGLTGACGYSFSQGPEEVAESDVKADEQEPTLETEREEPAAEKQPDSPRNPHFLSLEDQRVADLAFRMLKVEVRRVAEEMHARIKEAGFESGVQIEVPSSDGGFGGNSSPLADGDILVGLHVWPTAGFDGLAEVLRRDDLSEFNPLKFYVLRPTPEEQIGTRRGLRRGTNEMGRGGYGGEMSGRGGYGGEMGGYGGEFAAPPAKPEMTYKLVTGRIRFDNDAWRGEQGRLARRAESTFTKERETARQINTAFGEESEQFGVGVNSDAGIVGEVVPDDPQPVAPPLAKLTYNGRTFEEWNTQWRTELSEEMRIETVEALAAFGRAGHVREAVLAILDLASEYDFHNRRSGSRGLAVKVAVLKVFGCEAGQSLPTTGWLNVLRERAREDPGRYSGVLAAAVRYLDTGNAENRQFLQEVFEESEDVDVRGRVLAAFEKRPVDFQTTEGASILRRAMNDPSPSVRSAAISAAGEHLLQASQASGEQYRSAKSAWSPHLTSALLSNEPDVRATARNAIAKLPSDSVNETSVDVIRRVMTDPTQGVGLEHAVAPATSEEEKHTAVLAAIRACSVLRVNNVELQGELARIAKSNDLELALAAVVAADATDNTEAESRRLAIIDGSTAQLYDNLLRRFHEELLPGIDYENPESVKRSIRRVQELLESRVHREVEEIGLERFHVTMSKLALLVEQGEFPRKQPSQ